MRSSAECQFHFQITLSAFSVLFCQNTAIPKNSRRNKIKFVPAATNHLDFTWSWKKQGEIQCSPFLGRENIKKKKEALLDKTPFSHWNLTNEVIDLALNKVSPLYLTAFLQQGSASRLRK